MIVVIIAGGSGTRLWPLSTHDYPKHLLKLTGERSLLQNTYERVLPLAEKKNIFVVSEKSHAKHIYDQLDELPRKNVLVEPARRGTASCFVLALSEIQRRQLGDQPVFFLWADHLVQDKKSFAITAKLAAKLAAKYKKLVFTGIKPTYPTTGLGYMQKGSPLKNESKNTFKLKQFVEKPDHKTAEQYFKSGEYLWNTGYLTGTVSTFEHEIKEHAPRLWNDYQALNDTVLPLTRRRLYMDFVSEPIDTALSEHVPEGLLVQCDYDWLDVGNFRDLYDVSQLDKGGNHISGENIELENVKDSYVRNETDIPVAVIGVEDVAVIATDNGILITNKEHAQKVGDISKKLQAGKENLKWYEKL